MIYTSSFFDELEKIALSSDALRIYRQRSLRHPIFGQKMVNYGISGTEPESNTDWESGWRKEIPSATFSHSNDSADVGPDGRVFYSHDLKVPYDVAMKNPSLQHMIQSQENYKRSPKASSGKYSVDTGLNEAIKRWSHLQPVAKTAEQKQEPGEGPGGPFVTKDRLKRLMHVALVGAAGAGLGTAAGYATRDYLFKHHPNIVAKYAPVAFPVLGSALGILQSMHRPHVDQYVRYGKHE